MCRAVATRTVLFNVFIAVLLDKMLSPDDNKPDWSAMFEKLTPGGGTSAQDDGEESGGMGGMGMGVDYAVESSVSATSSSTDEALASLRAEQKSMRADIGNLASTLARIEKRLNAVASLPSEAAEGAPGALATAVKLAPIKTA